MDLIDFKNYYNGFIQEYDNSIYQKIETRFVHLFNFLNQDAPFNRWFNKRLDYYLKHAAEFDCVVDLGFSVPYPYFTIKKEELESISTRFVFVDNQDSAGFFLKMLHALPEYNFRKELDTFLKIDLDSHESKNELENVVARYGPRNILVVASEIIEHLENPENCWESIQAISNISGVKSCKIFITIPIGIKIPSHNTFFLSIKEAKRYIESRISVEKYWDLVPPKELGEIPYAKGCVCALGIFN